MDIWAFLIHARQKSTKIKFLGPETARWGGVFHAKGWWPKSSCPPSKVCLPWVSKGGIWDVPGFVPGCPGPLSGFKKFVQKKFVRIFCSLRTHGQINIFRVGSHKFRESLRELLRELWVFALLKSWDAIPRMGFLIPRIVF